MNWAELASFVLGFVLLFFPNLAMERRLAIGIPLALMPISIPALVWLWRVGRIVWLRVQRYPQLHQRARQDNEALAQVKQAVSTLVQGRIGSRAFEIGVAGWVQGKVYITLKKRRGHGLVVGDELMVIHTDDGIPMGWFEVTEVRSSEYYACGVHNVDAVWAGYVQQRGETFIQPHMAAIYVLREEG
jgi:hypothetical protein